MKTRKKRRRPRNNPGHILEHGVCKDLNTPGGSGQETRHVDHRETTLLEWVRIRVENQFEILAEILKKIYSSLKRFAQIIKNWLVSIQEINSRIATC